MDLKKWLHGSKLVLLSCVLIHSFIVISNNWIKYGMRINDVLQWNIIQGIAFLLYPVLGWIADVYISRYKMIKVSFILILLSSLLMLLGAIERICEHIYFRKEFDHALSLAKSILNAIVLLVGIGGLGIYEANAIQFGLQQLMEASSEKLSAFIHWYYWCIQLGSLITYYVTFLAVLYFTECTVKFDGFFHTIQDIQILGWVTFFPSLLQVVLALIGLSIMHCFKNHFEIYQTKINPFKTIFQVLKYSFTHKLPVRRSALTYWETKIPSRIDFGKHKYGGPFTNEEVEDMKSFFRLLLLMISLFGFFLALDTQSFATKFMIQRIGCPRLILLFLFVVNSDHIKIFIALIGIPMYHFLLKKYFLRYIPNLLTRIGIGLFLCLIKESFNPLLMYITNPSTTNQGVIQCDLNALGLFSGDNSSSITLCLIANGKFLRGNGTCHHICPEIVKENNLFYLLIIPQVIEGLSSLLVFMTVLEFICAQAPHTMKGLLIGVWYAMMSIHYVAVSIAKTNATTANNINYWTIHSGMKGFGIFTSIILYLIVCKFYRYRERDEVINEQQMIEEQYERELLQGTRNEENQILITK